MEKITIENVDYKNYHFTYAQYFNYKILINKDDGYINISKLLKILPKILNSRRKLNTTKGIDKHNRFDELSSHKDGGRARMSGNIGDDVTNKLEALKSKYK